MPAGLILDSEAVVKFTPPLASAQSPAATGTTALPRCRGGETSEGRGRKFILDGSLRPPVISFRQSFANELYQIRALSLGRASQKCPFEVHGTGFDCTGSRGIRPGTGERDGRYEVAPVRPAGRPPVAHRQRTGRTNQGDGGGDVGNAGIDGGDAGEAGWDDGTTRVDAEDGTTIGRQVY